MDSINNPWWLGGNICAGVPYGAEIASKLGARLWISAHDGEKDVRGLATGLLKTRRWKVGEIETALGAGFQGGEDNPKKIRHNGPEPPRSAQKTYTEIMRLDCGEEILVSGTGQLWRNTTKGDSQLIANPVTRTTAPPPPAPIKRMAVAATKHQGKYGKRTPEALVLPKVQNGMSPKTSAIYKTLRIKDLIKPSPRLVLEQDVTTEVKKSPFPGTKAYGCSRPVRGESKNVEAETLGIDRAVSKGDPSHESAVKFELYT
jgi:hypothetical protein